MLSQRIRRGIKYGTAAMLVGGSAYCIQKNDWEMSTVGVMRFGRAACTAVYIVLDYKWNLRNVDSESEEFKILKSKLHTRSAERLRELCCKNGGAYIKVGQHMGTLEYLLPKEYVAAMKVLHSRAPQSAVEEICRVFKEDIGKKVEEVFTSFSPEPLGTASLAQVHKATTKDGKVLAVKIQHPRVKAHSFVDIKTMEFLIRRVCWVFPEFQYVWLAEETRKNLPLELDFVREGHHCERVAKMFSHFKFLKSDSVTTLSKERKIKVPKIYWEYTNERVLTMEFCEGGQVDDLEYMKKHDINVNEVSRDLGKLYSEMIFVNGYVHCDPHPGNVLVNKTRNGTQIVLLDHGLYQSLTEDFRVNYSKLWMSLIQANMGGIKKYAQRLNVGELYPLFACMLTARSWKAIESGIEKNPLTNSENKEIVDNVGTYMVEISEILNTIPRQMLLIMKTNDVLRGIEASLNTRANASYFINMSKCCVRAHGNYKLSRNNGFISGVRIKLSTRVQLMKIEMYEFYLWLKSTMLFQYLFEKSKTAKSIS